MLYECVLYNIIDGKYDINVVQFVIINNSIFISLFTVFVLSLLLCWYDFMLCDCVLLI